MSETPLLLTVWIDSHQHPVSHGTSIGRDGSSSLQVAHSQVSRRHAEFRFENGGWSLNDLGSTNGLDVGQGRLSHVALGVGRTQIWLGPPSSSPCITADVAVAHHEPASSANQSTPGPPPVAVSPPTPGPPPVAVSPPSPGPPPVAVSPPSPGPPPVAPSEAVLQQAQAPKLAIQRMAPAVGRLTNVITPNSTEILIGRGNDCDLSIPDPLVSRHHARMYLDQSGGRIVDLQSDNGTWVNGNRVRETSLNEGDLVEMGKAQFVVQRGRLEQHIAHGLPLQADGLSVIVDNNLHIISDISFTLPAGSMTAVIGPSGSGKSTLLNALTGRRPADQGRVYLGGRDLYESDDIGRRIGFVPQDDPVHLTLSTSDALTAAARLRLPSDTNGAEISANVTQVAGDLGLAQRMETRVAALSGGQKKRVSVGYELVGEPQALILDEPTSGLDPGMERDLMASLRQLSDKGTTTIVVTHSVQSVELCDLVLVLAPGGRLAFLGPPDRVASHFQCADIASVFNLLGERPAEEWLAHFARSSSFQKYVADPIRTGASNPSGGTKRSFATDFAIMTSRYVKSLLGDRRRLGLLLLQAPILGALFSLLIPTDAFSVGEGPTTSTRQYLMATALVMIWLGGSNSVREIVDERSVFLREMAVGVSTSAFVLSKWLVLAVLTLIQAIVLHLTASWRQVDSLGSGLVLPSGQLEYILALAGIGIACVGLGLVVSATVTDAAKALGVLPLVTVSVFLLSGLVVPTSGRVGLEQVTYLNPIQWGASALAVTADLQAADGCFQTNPGVGAQPPQPGDSDAQLGGNKLQPASCENARWSVQQSTQLTNVGMLTLLGWLLVAAAAVCASWSLNRPLRR